MTKDQYVVVDSRGRASLAKVGMTPGRYRVRQSLRSPGTFLFERVVEMTEEDLQRSIDAKETT